MSLKAPFSPEKKKLLLAASRLPNIPTKARNIVSSGAQSIVIEENHNEVLLVTRYRKTAKNIELLRNRMKKMKSPLIDLPVLVGSNVSLVTLLTGVLKPSKELINAVKKQFGIPAELLNDNFVYRLPRYDGNLEELNSLRYKEDSIAALDKTLSDTIDLLHSLGLTHNDISLRNILYKGEYPKLSFQLCDWGSLTISDPVREKAKYTADLAKINRVIAKAQETFERKLAFIEQAQKEKKISANNARKAKEMGISPIKPEPKIKLENNKYGMVRNLLGELDAVCIKKDDEIQSSTVFKFKQVVPKTVKIKKEECSVSFEYSERKNSKRR